MCSKFALSGTRDPGKTAPALPFGKDRTLSPAKVSRKREYRGCRPETFGNLTAPLADKPPRDSAEYKKARHFRVFLDELGEATECPDCLAGDAVLIAPVSRAIPCKQGILQGNPQFQRRNGRFLSKKPRWRNHFSRNSLHYLTGKKSDESGSFGAGTGNFICKKHQMMFSVNR